MMLYSILLESIEVAVADSHLSRRGDAGGAPLRTADANVEFVNQRTQLACIVVAEIYVNRLLNRTEMRKLCDQQKTFKAIAASLQ